MDSKLPALSASGEQIWAELMQGNERFRTGTPQPRDLVSERQAVAHTRRPNAVVLACADSRVPPEIIFDQRLGELFVVRVAGNVADKQAIGSIEFAAEYLGAQLLLVIGHQECAAVTAARSTDKPASANLKAIIAAIRNGLPVSHDRSDPDGLREAVIANARDVARDILDRSELLRGRVQRGGLGIVTAYYHLDTGEVERT